MPIFASYDGNQLVEHQCSSVVTRMANQTGETLLSYANIQYVQNQICYMKA
jgi:hypothetical protein